MLPGGRGTAGRPLDVLFSLLSEMLIGAGISAPTESGLSAWRWQTAKTGPSWELLREYDGLSVNSTVSSVRSVQKDRRGANSPLLSTPETQT